MPGPQADTKAQRDSNSKQILLASMFENVDMVLKSNRLLANYFDCLMDRKPCSSESAELKIILPDALKSECSKCSEKQREGVEKLINYLIDNKPDMWKDLKAKFDPKGIYKQKSTTPAEDEGAAKQNN
ncbi:Hypothetical predicted protein [Cloeon dipterum]|nr:Hypothetical predicted protein [Cloeon dipterum]